MTVRAGTFTYLAATVESSLYRNGKVFTRRDGAGNDDTWEGTDRVRHRLPVDDARALSGTARPTLEVNGFERIDCPLPRPGFDFLDHDQVVRRYYPACAETIRAATGAAHAAAFDHNVRSLSGSAGARRSAGGQQVQPPLHMVHGDYTLTSAPQRLRDLARPSRGNDTYRPLLADGQTLLDPAEVAQTLARGRFAIVNLWRNIAAEPVATHPLALCDAASVRPEDLVVFEIHYAERIGENYYAKHADRHRWHCFPALTRDEALLIKQWDSEGTLARTRGGEADGNAPDSPCTFSFHSAFEDPTSPPDAPDRWSIEVRCAVLFAS